jgi:hypothetical protein
MDMIRITSIIKKTYLKLVSSNHNVINDKIIAGISMMQEKKFFSGFKFESTYVM